MTDHSPRGHRDDAAQSRHERDDEMTRALLDAIASGVHDDALVRLLTDALYADPESPVWTNTRFVGWWAEEVRARAAAERRVPDDEFLAAGRALRARVEARRLGIVRFSEAPPLRAASVVTTPGAVLDEAAEEGASPFVDLAVAAGVGRELWDEPAEQWLELPPTLRTSLRDSRPAVRHLAVRIVGDSMEPALRSRDTVLLALGVKPTVGAAVVARHPDDGYVCKRVRRVRATTLELESLAPGRPIIVVPRRSDTVLGVVVAVWGDRHR